MKKILLLFLFVLISTICYPTSVHATNFGLSISPPLLRVQIKPGKSITQVFKIENLSSNDRFLVARIVPFSQSDDRGNPILDLKATNNWLNYFSLSNANIRLDEPFTLHANSSEQLILSLSIPENAPLQDIYATLLVSTYNNVTDIGYQGTAISATIGSNLLISVTSSLNADTLLKINDFHITDGTFFKVGHYFLADNITPLHFSAHVQNSGNFTSETKGLFKILGRKDQPVYLEGLLPTYVISKNSRLLLNSHNQDFAYTPNLANIGLYHALIDIKTDNSNTTSTITIIFFPFKICIGIFISLIFLITIFKIGVRRNDVGL